MTQWKSGDVVRLKSGGPTMTINGKAASTASSYICQWFDGPNQMTGVFNSEMLVAVQDNTPPPMELNTV